MPTEIREEGYQSIRNLIDSSASLSDQWAYIELRDDSNSQVIRVNIENDSRAEWTHTSGDQTLVAEITVSGGDSDIPTPTTFEGSALYDTSSGGDELSYDSFASATIEASSDELTVTHRVEVPQV